MHSAPTRCGEGRGSSSEVLLGSSRAHVPDFRPINPAAGRARLRGSAWESQMQADM